MTRLIVALSKLSLELFSVLLILFVQICGRREASFLFLFGVNSRPWVLLDGGREAMREHRSANADWTAKDKHVYHAHGIILHVTLYATCSLALGIFISAFRVSVCASASASRSGYPSFCVASNSCSNDSFARHKMQFQLFPKFRKSWCVFVILSLIHILTASQSLHIVVAR